MALRRLMAERVCVDAAASTTTGLLELAVVATLNHRRRVHVSSGHSAASTRAVDLRSDTITTPTPGMRTAIANAIVGDDVYGEVRTCNSIHFKMPISLGQHTWNNVMGNFFLFLCLIPDAAHATCTR